MRYNWISLMGDFKLYDNSKIIYNGKSDDSNLFKIGHLIFNKSFEEGIIKAEVEFKSIRDEADCDILFYNNDSADNFIIACVGMSYSKNHRNMFALKSLNNGQWNFHKISGDNSSFQLDHKYKMEMSYYGNIVILKVDGIKVLESRLPINTSKTQVGIWTRSNSECEILIHDYEVIDKKIKAFVVMQFGSHFDELYRDVICNVVEKEMDIQVIRSDDIYNNQMIINDIKNSIDASRVVIADVTPQNPNVYYEVGYAHASGKTTILLAEKGTKLPFDVSPYRVIFYENTIGGKVKVEEALRKHMNEILK